MKLAADARQNAFVAADPEVRDGFLLLGKGWTELAEEGVAGYDLAP